MTNRFQDQWETNAEVFTDLIAGLGTPHQRDILNPCVEELVGDVRGKRLLDAGCGEGYLSRYYAGKGAIVTGVDFSNRLIENARRLTEEKGVSIEYEIANICKSGAIQENEFDIVLCNLVLLNIPCLDDALGEFYRVLKKGGYFVFSIVHPSFNFYGPGTWEMGEKNSETGRRRGLFFKVDQYFEEKEYERFWKTREGEDFPVPISFFHRTLETYLSSLIKSGFELVEFREPRPREERPFFERESRIPFFIVVKAKKS